MAQSFLLGIQQVWEDLSVMQAPGFYWVNIDRQTDAHLLCRQIVEVQPENGKLALICGGENPNDLLAELISPVLKKLPLYTLPEEKAAVLYLSTDLMRTLRPKNRLLILLAPASLWQAFSNDELHTWLDSINQWLHQQQCTLVILSHSSGVNKLKGQLSNQHRLLNGLASLQWQQSSAQYLVNWWSTPNSINANQLVTLYSTALGWQGEGDHHKPSPVPVHSDESLYLAEKSILEGAPPLSASWQLLENGLLLTQQGMQLQAATLIFALYQSEQIDVLASQIHSLRLHCGNGMKIVVREMSASLRYSDERLLLACGANLVVPHIAPLSSFLTMIEGIQGQQLSRHVPADIDVLLASLRQMPLKGYLPLADFSKAVISLMENTLLPEDGKGVLVALRPAPGLSARQSITLCHLRRFGDVMTVANNRLFLFLSTCRINDLKTALKFIFQLPVDEAFSNWVAWYQDIDIKLEIKAMNQNMVSRQASIEHQSKLTTRAEIVTDAPPERRQPAALSLFQQDKTP